jgi:hypothetical protein
MKRQGSADLALSPQSRDASQQGLPVSPRGKGVIRRLAQGSPRRGRPRSSPTARPGRYACEENGCGRLFDRRYNLKVHMRMHDGAMPFSCPSCDRKFRWRASLHHHLRAHLRSEEAALRHLDPPDTWTAPEAAPVVVAANAPVSSLPPAVHQSLSQREHQPHQHHVQVCHEQMLQHHLQNLEQHASAEQSPLQLHFAMQRTDASSGSQVFAEIAPRVADLGTRSQPRADLVNVIEVIESCYTPSANRNDLKVYSQSQPSAQEWRAPQISATLQEMISCQTVARGEPAAKDQVIYPIASTTSGGGPVYCSPKQTVPVLSIPPIASPSWTSECSSASTRTNRTTGGPPSSLDDINVVISRREELDWSLLDLKNPNDDFPVSPSAISDVTVKREELKLLSPDDVDELIGFNSFIDHLAIGPSGHSDYPASHEVDSSVVRSFRL